MTRSKQSKDKFLMKTRSAVTDTNESGSASEDNSGEGGIMERMTMESTTDTDPTHHDDENAAPMNNDEFERVAIKCFRLFVFALMLAATIAAGFTSWFFLDREESNNFNQEDIKQVSQDRTSDLVAEFRSLSSTITALSINSKTNWPFFTDLNYPTIVANFMETAGVTMVAIAPFVKNEVDLQKWADYSQANQEWIPQSLLLEQQPDPSNYTQIFPGVFRNSAGGRIPEKGDGPFAPVWQMFQAPRDGRLVNFNMLSDPHYKEIFESLMEEKTGALSDRLGPNNAGLMENFPASTQYFVNRNPISMFIAPVFKDATNQEIVATVSAAFNWMNLFALPSGELTPPVDVVLNDGCANEFTFRVTGSVSEFVGFGSLHDPTYEEHERSFAFSPSLRTYHVGGTGCSYQVRVFPTKSFWDTYHTTYPASMAGVITAVFILVGIILYMYDAAVHMRQSKILAVASRSEKILSVLYPKTIRDRLFGIEEETVTEEQKSSQGASAIRRFNEDLLKKANKYQLKSFMKSTPSAHPHETDFLDTKPIADLFLHATVLFADISGFTAWSSVREPTQVFTLLESVYRTFDITAKRRNVFKVETVGDCYVAVTGLPEPTKAHATIMASFARACVEKFEDLVGSLETTLGPDTGDLGIRVGMHSGPVTAGVLRGEKARFQLFGDTVNTASRIESSGERNRIHLSQETADLLAAAGKSHWLSSREQLVTAKGKGKLQTYWLLTKQEEASINITSQTVDSAFTDDEASDDGSGIFLNSPSVSSEFSLDLGTSTLEDIEKSLPSRTRRLCQWNVDVLTRLLKQIVAHRLASDLGNKDWESDLSRREKEIRRHISVLDEVVEIIPLPGFDQSVYKGQQAHERIELSEAVIEQIRLYVACIAAMYKDNPFHNFEHASHVMMSVSKLLSRIIAADDVLNADQNAASSDDLLGWSIHDHTYGITSDPMTQFTVILAAMVHDVDHSGVSNNQLINEGSKLADLFNNKSVAEQNSTVLAWDILMHPRFQDFRRTIYAAPYELDRFRQLMTNTVLATDIMDKELQALRRNRWDAAFNTNAALAARSEEATKDMVNRKATIVIEHLIQASDVAHTMQHWHIYCKWNERLFQEMAVAYKAGRLPFNPAEKWYEGEIGFLDNYVIPLAKKLKNCGVFGVASDEYLNYAMENRCEWEEKGRDFVATLTARYMDDPNASTGMMMVQQQENKRSSRRLTINMDSRNYEEAIAQVGKQ
ncbi:unnamed protein product [Cylindrotheca closterium]|uniref:Phosphodiesterase n=1 Tax=Cylindrotheca closterium TaxID=2856 RepID=A0AAD2G3A0_9STRA|nr:unnamed protein product [Cylindrotheca closterium]